MKKVVVVGGSHSGASFAINLKKRLKDAVQIKVIEKGTDEEFSFVGADGLLWVSGGAEKNILTYSSPEKLRSFGIEVLTRTNVKELDFEKQQVIVESIDSEHIQEESEKVFEYDYLVLATGSSPTIPEFAVSKMKDLEELAETEAYSKVQTMKSFYDAINLKKLVESKDVKKIAIIGGGYIGVETAEALKLAGKNCSIIQSNANLCNGYYDPEFSKHIKTICERKGIDVQTNSRVNELDFDKFDAYILSLGFYANSELGGNQIERELGAYLVDAQQRTSQVNVYAIGDSSTVFNNASNENTYIAIGSGTSKEASILADVIASEIQGVTPEEFNFGTQCSNALSIFNFKLASTGLTEELAKKKGFKVLTPSYFGSLRAEYIAKNAPELLEEFEGEKVQIKIVIDFETKRILGAQIASYTDAVNLVNVFSLAIERGLTVFDLKNLDLFFLPAINQLYNIIRRTLSKITTESFQKEN